jgi:hypothetical protein
LYLRAWKLQGAGEDLIMRSFLTCTFSQILLGDYVKEDEMGGACSTRGRDEKYTKFWSGNVKKPFKRTRRRWDDNI